MLFSTPEPAAAPTAIAAADYYKLEIDGEAIHEIDVENCTRIVNGVDQVAARGRRRGCKRQWLAASDERPAADRDPLITIRWAAD